MARSNGNEADLFELLGRSSFDFDFDFDFVSSLFDEFELAVLLALACFTGLACDLLESNLCCCLDG